MFGLTFILFFSLGTLPSSVLGQSGTCDSCTQSNQKDKTTRLLLGIRDILNTKAPISTTMILCPRPQLEGTVSTNGPKVYVVETAPKDRAPQYIFQYSNCSDVTDLPQIGRPKKVLLHDPKDLFSKSDSVAEIDKDYILSCIHEVTTFMKKKTKFSGAPQVC